MDLPSYIDHVAQNSSPNAIKSNAFFVQCRSANKNLLWANFSLNPQMTKWLNYNNIQRNISFLYRLQPNSHILRQRTQTSVRALIAKNLKCLSSYNPLCWTFPGDFYCKRKQVFQYNKDEKWWGKILCAYRQSWTTEVLTSTCSWQQQLSSIEPSDIIHCAKIRSKDNKNKKRRHSNTLIKDDGIM